MVFAWLVTGCQAISDIASEIAKNAPEAKSPKITEVAKLKQWPDDERYYSSGYSFDLLLEHGFSNELTLYVNGKEVVPFNGEDPENGSRTVYIVEDVDHDESAKTTTSRYTVLPPQGQPTNRSVAKYEFRERSINPAHAGTSSEFASTTFEVVTITEPPTIAFFNAPRSVEIGASADLSWRVNNCKQTELLENQAIIASEISPEPAATLEGSKSLAISQNTGVMLRATNATGRVVQSELVVAAAPPPPCPGNPGGQPQAFTFCVECMGGSLGPFRTQWTQYACNESDARTLIQRANLNCTLTAGPCPTGSSFPPPSSKPTPG